MATDQQANVFFFSTSPAILARICLQSLPRALCPLAAAAGGCPAQKQGGRRKIVALKVSLASGRDFPFPCRSWCLPAWLWSALCVCLAALPTHHPMAPSLQVLPFPLFSSGPLSSPSLSPPLPTSLLKFPPNPHPFWVVVGVESEDAKVVVVVGRTNERSLGKPRTRTFSSGSSASPQSVSSPQSSLLCCVVSGLSASAPPRCAPRSFTELSSRRKASLSVWNRAAWQHARPIRSLSPSVGPFRAAPSRTLLAPACPSWACLCAAGHPPRVKGRTGGGDGRAGTRCSRTDVLRPVTGSSPDGRQPGPRSWPVASLPRQAAAAAQPCCSSCFAAR